MNDTKWLFNKKSTYFGFRRFKFTMGSESIIRTPDPYDDYPQAMEYHEMRVWLKFME